MNSIKQILSGLCSSLLLSLGCEHAANALVKLISAMKGWASGGGDSGRQMLLTAPCSLVES